MDKKASNKGRLAAGQPAHQSGQAMLGGLFAGKEELTHESWASQGFSIGVRVIPPFRPGTMEGLDIQTQQATNEIG